MQKQYTIYVITNKINGKLYVGQTSETANRRFIVHKSKAKRKDESSPLYKAINEFGEENFYVKSLENGIEEKMANSREAYWINELNTLYPNGYNVQSGGRKSYKFSKTYINFVKNKNPNMGLHGDIIMLDNKTGEEIAIFRCATYAERFLKRNGIEKENHWPITRCCMGKQKTAYGYKWAFRNDV